MTLTLIKDKEITQFGDDDGPPGIEIDMLMTYTNEIALPQSEEEWKTYIAGINKLMAVVYECVEPFAAALRVKIEGRDAMFIGDVEIIEAWMERDDD